MLSLQYSSINSQFGQRGEQRAVSGVFLEVVCDRLNDSHVVVELSWPFPDQHGKTLFVEEAQKIEQVIT